jgi:hypothetical protein
MSQIFKSATGSTPSIPTSFVTDAGTATTAANTLNVLGGQLVADHDEGIWTTGSGDTLTVNLTNRSTGQVTTSDDTPTTIVSFTFGGSAAVATFEGIITAMNNVTGEGASWRLFASSKTNGTTTTEIGSDASVNFKEASLATANVTFTAVGNAVLISAVGIAATSINWDALINYRQVL